jgi:Tfp pilus assembly protein PilF
VDAVALTEEAASRLEAGDAAAARDALVAAASAHRSAGNVNAALDACYLALEIAPADADLHLLLARLYVDHGWDAHATEKLRLLDRLTELSGDRKARTEVRQLVAALADAADEAAPHR